ncbi:signal transduction histidine kinase [Prauserella shujinwangii]|uniref:histidine kinase n=1 Tax=Prauserella shujinwangii TaxID=1453103 RepID=A0A2T0M344_9PSEU|nr:nitrate- and nitrite sensing domain-containing protein [Prauserella shujinwangii]PRX51181.1 signal transduction histidine kinase [Prauserella shujinwangii]
MPVGKLLGQQPPKPSKWRALVQWRDWSLPVKLSAVTVVPIIIALVLGAITLTSQVSRSDRYERIDRLVTLNESVRTLLDGLQRERARTTELLTDGLGGDDRELNGIRADVDRATGPVTDAAKRAAELQPGIAGAGDEVAERLGGLAELRTSVAEGRLDPVEAATGYTAITSALLGLDTALTAGIGDDELGGTAGALHNLLVAREAVSVEQALVGYGVARGGLAPSELNEIRTQEVRFGDRIEEFRTTASEDQRAAFEAAVPGEPFDTRQRIVGNILAEQGTGGGSALRATSARQWADASGAVRTGLGQVADQLGGTLTARSAELAENASTGAGLLAVLLFAALVLAAFVVFVITRQLLRSLRLLRSSALEVAQSELPSAVRNIQEGRSQSTDIRPVPIDTAEEIGEVARAFDAVHSEALRLAVEQAAMRTGYASVFVNLSRRSQSLVQRQLQLIERLERDEEDADQLATLFQLDHLATRMRRNNENLMVLSGAEPGRRSGQPVSATDVLRAAVSEIEQYQRVVVRTPPQVRIVGYAASDLMRLVAELLDNATAFSAPETQVTVVTRAGDDGSLSIDILDKGIGMNEAEVAEANARLSEAASIDLATSRRMGLFVVGRLAGRHGFGVSLHGGRDIVGVRATVTVPAELVMSQQGQDRPQAQAAPAERGDQGAQPRLPVNGAARQAALPTGTTQSEVERRLAPPPTDQEISGTALFSPIDRDEASPPRAPQQAQQTPRAPQAQQPPQVPAQGAAGRTGQPAADERDTESLGRGTAEARDQQGPAAEQGERVNGSRVPPRSAPPDRTDSGELPAGKELFEANSTAVSDWWSAATTASDAERKAAVDNAETTPIFDEMLSAWFRSVTDPDNDPPERAKDRDVKNPWDFAVDESWRTVQEVSRTSPSDYTEAGLPRRRRGEKLLPGSAAPGTGGGEQAERTPGTGTEQPQRDPADVRGRLSSFQQGVSRGRRQSRSEPARAAGSERADAQQGTASGLPQRQPKRQGHDGSAAESGAPAGGPGWAFPPDDRWQAVQSVTEPAPTSFTPAGLPRRRRGERLLPGSANSQATAENRPRSERDPADVRGRLSSFQQGVRRGRHRTAQASEGNQEKVEGE